MAKPVILVPKTEHASAKTHHLKYLKDRSRYASEEHYLKYLKDRSRYTISDEKTAFFHSRPKGTARSAQHFGKRQTTGENRREPAKTGGNFGAL